VAHPLEHIQTRCPALKKLTISSAKLTLLTAAALKTAENDACIIRSRVDATCVPDVAILQRPSEPLER
jgi:hypothetical protein